MVQEHHIWHIPSNILSESLTKLNFILTLFLNTVVSRIYAPPFATLALVENVGGAYMRDLTFYLANTPPLRCHA